jgi:hypothetical protein
MLESWHEPAPADESPRLTRRSLLAGSGGAMLVAAGARSDAIDATVVEQAALEHGASVVLQDRRLVLPEDACRRLAARGVRVLELEGDPVRMWRGEHAAMLADSGTRLLGVTPWIEFVMIQGLAAESRRRVRYQRFDATRNAMVWLIA